MKALDLTIIEKISYEYAKRHLVMIDEIKKDCLVVSAYKIDYDTKQYLTTLFGEKIKVQECDKDELLNRIDDIYLKFICDSNYEKSKFLKEIIKTAAKYNSSDIHIEPYENKCNIRFRIDGIMRLVFIISKSKYFSLIGQIKFMANMDLSGKLLPHDGKMIINDDNDERLDLRISSIPTIWGEKIVIRILSRDEKLLNLNNLIYSDKQKNILENIIKLQDGLIIICGATGSGKSTTLYALIKNEEIDERNIITIEDPVEFQMDGVNQININEKSGLTFPIAIKYILRQDPDVILIGEVRDEGTAQSAVRAAITGHKVYTTLHTDSIFNIYGRLKDMDVKEYLIKDCLKAVISQKLVRRLCPYCRAEEANKNNQYNLLKSYKAVGCDKCNDGYKGRVVLYEMIYIKGRDKENLSRGTFDNDDNFLTIDECLKCYAENGLISLEDYVKYMKLYGVLK